MKKEAIICIVIVVAIIIGNITTQKYTVNSVEETSKNLEELREKLKEESIKENNEEIEEKKEEINKKWKERYKRLAYFIEHDELEKVNTNFVEMNSFIESKEYKDAIGELDKGTFVLKHIQDKYAFNLENIF